MGITEEKVTRWHIHTIRRFLHSDEFTSLEELPWDSTFRKMLLYPVDDFHLFADQFNAVVSLLDETEHLYVLRIGYNGRILDPANAVYAMSAPFAYSEYEKLWLDTPTILFSDAKEWVVVTDESADYGEGLFVGQEESFQRFRAAYGNGRRDLAQFMEFSVRERRQRNVPMDHAENMLKLCETEKKEE